MTESTTDRRILDALERWHPDYLIDELRLATTSTASGQFAYVYAAESNDFVGSLYLHADTGTVYSVPSWVSRPAAMDRAVADLRKRARLAVV